MEAVKKLLGIMAVLALETLGHHGRGSGADGTALTNKTDILDNLILYLQIHGNLVTAKGIVAFRMMIAVIHSPEIARRLVVIQNHLLINFL
jgi:hypothetical protein